MTPKWKEKKKRVFFSYYFLFYWTKYNVNKYMKHYQQIPLTTLWIRAFTDCDYELELSLTVIMN